MIEPVAVLETFFGVVAGRIAVMGFDEAFTSWYFFSQSSSWVMSGLILYSILRLPVRPAMTTRGQKSQTWASNNKMRCPDGAGHDEGIRTCAKPFC